MITIDDEIRDACHLAALRAIDETLNDYLPGRTYWIRDDALPDLLPAIDRAIDRALAAKPCPGQIVRNP